MQVKNDLSHLNTQIMDFVWVAQEVQPEVNAIVESQQESLNADGRRLYNEHIKLLAGQIFYQIAQMRRNGVSPAAISETAKMAMAKLRLSGEEFLRGHERFLKRQEEVSSQLDQTQRHVESATLSFSRSSISNVMRKYQRAKADVTIKIVHATAEVLRVADEAIAKTLKFSVGDGSQAFCLLTSGMEQKLDEAYGAKHSVHLCENLATAAQQGASALKPVLKEAKVDKAIQKVSDILHSIPPPFPNNLGIPEETIKQYQRDHLTIVQWVIPSGLIGKGFKKPLVSMKLIGESTCSKIIEIGIEGKRLSEKVTWLFKDSNLANDLVKQYHPKTQQTVNEISNILKDCESYGKPGLKSIKAKMNDLKHVIPIYSGNPTDIWQRMLKEFYPFLSSDFDFQFLPGHHIFKVSHGQQHFVIKESRNGAYIVQKMNDLNQPLYEQLFRYPRPIGIGRYPLPFERSQRYFFLRTHLPGESLVETTYNMASHPIESLERKLLRKDLVEVSRQIGEKLGIYQSIVKMGGFTLEPSRELRKLYFDEACKLFSKHTEHLDFAFKVSVIKKSPRIKSLFKELKFQEERVVRGFPDLWQNSVLLHKEETGHIVLGLTKAEISPHLNTPLGEEFPQLFHGFDKGLQIGITKEETREFQQALTEGYRSTQRREVPKASQEFYNIVLEIEKAAILSKQFPENPHITKEMLQEILDSLKDKL